MGDPLGEKVPSVIIQRTVFFLEQIIDFPDVFEERLLFPDQSGDVRRGQFEFGGLTLAFLVEADVQEVVGWVLTFL